MNTDPLKVNPVSHGESGNQEMSLIEMLTVLRRGSRVILLIASATAFLSFSYSFSKPASFKSKAVFLPPSEADIQHFKMPISLLNSDDVRGGEGVTVDSVYALFQRHLESHHARRQVFSDLKVHQRYQDEGNPDITVEDAYASFYDSFSLSMPELLPELRLVSPVVTLAVTANDGAFARKVGEQLSQQAIVETTATLFSNIKTNVVIKREEIESEISTLRAGALEARLYEISRLEDAEKVAIFKIKDKIKIARLSASRAKENSITALTESALTARDLNLKDPLSAKLDKISQADKSSASIITNGDAKGGSAYSRGYVALEAELAILKARENDDPFIPSLVGLLAQLEALSYNRALDQLRERVNDDPYIPSLFAKQSKLTDLNAITYENESSRVVTVDRPSSLSTEPTGPSRMMMAIIGLLAGCFVGMFCVLVKHAAQDVQRPSASV
jgi:chain length determinant protein (polysaccharide antigen chain regulator)